MKKYSSVLVTFFEFEKKYIGVFNLATIENRETLLCCPSCKAESEYSFNDFQICRFCHTPFFAKNGKKLTPRSINSKFKQLPANLTDDLEIKKVDKRKLETSQNPNPDNSKKHIPLSLKNAIRDEFKSCCKSVYALELGFTIRSAYVLTINQLLQIDKFIGLCRIRGRLPSFFFGGDSNHYRISKLALKKEYADSIKFIHRAVNELNLNAETIDSLFEIEKQESDYFYHNINAAFVLENIHHLEATAFQQRKISKNITALTVPHILQMAKSIGVSPGSFFRKTPIRCKSFRPNVVGNKNLIASLFQTEALHNYKFLADINNSNCLKKSYVQITKFCDQLLINFDDLFILEK